MGRKDWWQEVTKLCTVVDTLYAQATAEGKSYTKLSVTQDKIVQARKWTPSLPVIQKNFPQALQELNCFYVPKTRQPGPMIVFPLRDIYNLTTRAQTKPFEGSAEYGDHKYMYLGKGSKEFSGPCWLGNDPLTLLRIIEKRFVVLVEGAFDLLACRLVAPEVPSMSSLTKSIGMGHQLYLRMLGVDTIYLMFDNEKPKDDKYDIGGGELSMRALKRDVQGMKVEILYCPSEDPSKALESYVKAGQLKSLLLGL